MDRAGREAGAEAVVGGHREGDRGYFVQPTILTNTSNEMKVVREESLRSRGVRDPVRLRGGDRPRRQRHELRPSGRRVHREGLAVVKRLEHRELVGVLLDELGDAPDEPAAIRRVHASPR